jgi:hypothetical protein
LAELDALKREQQADGARIKQEVRRGAARRGAARRGHTHCGTAQHSTAAPTERLTSQQMERTNGNVRCCAARCGATVPTAPHCTALITHAIHPS